MDQTDRERALLVLADRGRTMKPELIDVFALLDLYNDAETESLEIAA